MKHRGFTLIELAISLTIIGIITVAVLKGQSLIDQSRIDDAIKLSEDFGVAVKEFQTRYKLLPGDMRNPPIANLIVACQGGGLGNGNVSAAESRCIPEVLSKAGMIKTSGIEGGFPVIRSYYGLVSVISADASQVVTIQGNNPFPRSSLVVEFADVPCEAAQAIERKIDNDDFTTGRVAASIDACVAGAIVPFLAISF